MNDRFGIGWRPELAAGILSNLDRIDIVEVIADDYFDASKIEASCAKNPRGPSPGRVARRHAWPGIVGIAVDSKRLEQTARLVGEIQPEFWSEHLAFVRGGGLEIGHLAAPPRTDATVEGAAWNLTAAKKIVGTMPLVENVATLIDPPASQLSEADWTSEILAVANCNLLLDLHNLYANAVNFGFDPYDFIDRMPQEKIRAIHLAGGRWIKAKTTDERRLLDDHLHDVPETVYDLLEYTVAKTSHPLTVILERDGRYPPIEILLNQLDRARDALRRVRAKQLSEAA